jgi:hypothetical protein
MVRIPDHLRFEFNSKNRSTARCRNPDQQHTISTIEVEPSYPARLQNLTSQSVGATIMEPQKMQLLK